MRLTNYIKLVAIVAFTPPLSIVTGQTFDTIQLDVDYAAFAYSDSESMVEIYLAFEAASLSYEYTGQGYTALLPVKFDISRSSSANLTGTPSEPVWQESLDLSFVIPDTTGLREGQNFVHQVRLSTTPGEYELSVTVQGVDQPAVEIQRDVLVPDFSTEGEVSISDVTLAISIEQSSDRNDLFFKNGLVVRPNANQIFGSGLNQMFYYAEVYGADVLPSTTGNYSIFAYIAEANVPQPMPDYQKRTQRTINATDVLIGSFDVSKLPSGSYFLRLAVLSEDNEAVTEQSRKFFVYNPFVERAQPTIVIDESFETSRYADMTEEEVELSLKHIQIIATEAERRRARGIQDLDERRRFLMDFWAMRDPVPGTPINEFQEDFFSRIQYANDRYSTNFEEGWDTDRGRTMIKYGPPTGIQPHFFDSGVIPYEIWEYNNIPGEGRAEFVFADRDGFGRFELIHSNVAGERKLANWLQELTKI
ncbi:MAG: hypothetical protein BMS9Abin05_1748 [Rhodothermia bacterium]|nr:MAG: hypothetical protein BMS9Abin05_1748 [Rhodothermia bacterium]